MQDLDGKAVDGSLTNTEWNGRQTEIQNIVTAFEALSGVSDNQLGQAIAAMAAVSHFYTCTGSADVYTASVLPGIQAPEDYYEGMLVRMIPSAANTGSSTVNVAALGIKNIKREDGSALQVGDLITTRAAWMVYDGTDLLLSDWSSSQAALGADLDPSLLRGVLVRTSASVITLSKGIGGNITTVIDGVKLTQTADITFTMPGDLETGSEAASTQYYLYLSNETGTLTAHLSVTAPHNPGGGGKVGYHSGAETDWRCIGSVPNDASSDFVFCRWLGDGRVLFTKHDADHEHTLTGTESTSWRTQAVNVPESASAFHISISGKAPTGEGMLVVGADGATGTLTDAEVDPSAAGFENVLLHSASQGSNDGNGVSVHGEIPTITRSSPKLSYGNTKTMIELILLVTGYTDEFAPKT